MKKVIKFIIMLATIFIWYFGLAFSGIALIFAEKMSCETMFLAGSTIFFVIIWIVCCQHYLEWLVKEIDPITLSAVIIGLLLYGMFFIMGMKNNNTVISAEQYERYLFKQEIIEAYDSFYDATDNLIESTADTHDFDDNLWENFYTARERVDSLARTQL